MKIKNTNILLVISIILFSSITSSVSASAALVTAISNDTGISSNDLITRDSSLILSGVGPTDTYTDISIDGDTIGTYEVGSDGSFTADLSGFNMTEGTHEVVSYTNWYNSVESNIIYVTVDKSINTGIINTPIANNNIIESFEKTNLVISGSQAEPGAKVYVTISDGINEISTENIIVSEIIDNSSNIYNSGTILVDVNGNWNTEGIDISSLNEGTLYIKATIVDRAGNISDTDTVNAVMSYSSIEKPIITSILNDSGENVQNLLDELLGDDSTDLNNDFITNNNQLIIYGTSVVNNGEIEVFKDGVSLGKTNTDSEGNWEFNYTNVYLSDGEYSFSAIASYEEINSELSDIKNIIIDTQIPNDSKITTPLDGTNFTVNTEYSNIIINGTSSEGNAIVKIELKDSNENTIQYLAKTDTDGNWEIQNITLENFIDGVISIKLDAYDLAGNIYENQILTYIIKGNDFIIPVTITSFSDDSGILGDKITNDNTLLITGTSEYSNAVIKVYNNEIYIGDAYTDSEGNWLFDNSSIELEDGEYIFRTELVYNGENKGTSLPFKISIDSGVNNFTVKLEDINDNFTDDIINNLKPNFTGTCTEDSVINIKSGDKILANFTCDNSEGFNIESDVELDYGINNILATETDSVGNIITLPEFKILILRNAVYADIQEAVSQVPEFTGNCNNSGIIIKEGSNIIDYITDNVKVKNFVAGFYNPSIEYGNNVTGILNNKINLYIDNNKVSEGYCTDNKVGIKYDNIVNGKHTTYVTQENILGNISSKSTEVNFRADKGLILPDPKIYNEKEEKLYFGEFLPELVDGFFDFTSSEINSLLLDLFGDTNSIFTSRDTSPTYEISCNNDGSEIRVFVDGLATDKVFNCNFPDGYDKDFYKMLITTPYLANGEHSVSYTETTQSGLTAQSSEVIVNIDGVRSDVNADGRINSIDLSLLIRRITQLDMQQTSWIDSHIGGDVNCDGIVNSIDMSLMNMKVAQFDMSNTSWCE